MHFPADNDPQTTYILSWGLDKETAEGKVNGGRVLNCTANIATVTLSAMMLVGVEGDEKSSSMLDCGRFETLESTEAIISKWKSVGADPLRMG